MSLRSCARGGIDVSDKMSRLAALRSRVSGPLDRGVLPSGASDVTVWQHIREGLEALAANGRADQAELSENALTQRLIEELNGREGNFPFFFDKDHMEDESDGNSRRVDFAVKPKKSGAFVIHGIQYAFPARFLALEAKRLPTPTKEREREYLAGNQGGVERFKRGLHGSGLKEVGLIGYVQRQSFGYWRDRINQWVNELLKSPPSDLFWDEQDRLVLEAESERLAQLRSSSLRGSDNQRLAIRHLWVQLAPTAPQAVLPCRCPSVSGEVI